MCKHLRLRKVKRQFKTRTMIRWECPDCGRTPKAQNRIPREQVIELMQAHDQLKPVFMELRKAIAAGNAAGSR